MIGILRQHQDKWTPEPNSGCFIWTGAMAGTRQPRPRVEIDGKKFYVARLICEEVYGPMEGYLACHKTFCNIPECVNPNHLYRGTASQNMMDIPAEVRLASSRAANAAQFGAKP